MGRCPPSQQPQLPGNCTQAHLVAVIDREVGQALAQLPDSPERAVVQHSLVQQAGGKGEGGRRASAHRSAVGSLVVSSILMPDVVDSGTAPCRRRAPVFEPFCGPPGNITASNWLWGSLLFCQTKPGYCLDPNLQIQCPLLQLFNNCFPCLFPLCTLPGSTSPHYCPCAVQPWAP